VGRQPRASRQQPGPLLQARRLVTRLQPAMRPLLVTPLLVTPLLVTPLLVRQQPVMQQRLVPLARWLRPAWPSLPAWRLVVIRRKRPKSPSQKVLRAPTRCPSAFGGALIAWSRAWPYLAPSPLLCATILTVSSELVG